MGSLGQCNMGCACAAVMAFSRALPFWVWPVQGPWEASKVMPKRVRHHTHSRTDGGDTRGGRTSRVSGVASRVAGSRNPFTCLEGTVGIGERNETFLTWVARRHLAISRRLCPIGMRSYSAPSMLPAPSRYASCALWSRTLLNRSLKTGGTCHPSLNTSGNVIANKYHEGKMKSTLNLSECNRSETVMGEHVVWSCH